MGMHKVFKAIIQNHFRENRQKRKQPEQGVLPVEEIDISSRHLIDL